jgi:SAM-dependent methyltransferase
VSYMNSYYAGLPAIRLDIGCGLNPKKGFIGIDNFAGIKAQALNPDDIDVTKLNIINHDLSNGIPFENSSVDEIIASHFLEHVGYLDRLLEEANRVLKAGHKFEIIVPYANSAEGMYPGHSIFFTEKWFLNNLLFNELFRIREITFYESDYYAEHKDKISRLFTFDEARLFLFNCCWQMQIVTCCKKGSEKTGNSLVDIEYGTVSHGGMSKAIRHVKRRIPSLREYFKSFFTRHT